MLETCSGLQLSNEWARLYTVTLIGSTNTSTLPHTHGKDIPGPTLLFVQVQCSYWSAICILNPFPALIKSKNLLKIDHFCFYFTSSRWSAVSVNHSKPPESVMNQLQDGGGFVA